MKKNLLFVAALIFSVWVGTVCYAAENLGYAKYTAVVTYINHIPIQSHNFNGKTLIAAEDLTNFGFNVKWNEYKRCLTITRDTSRNEINMPYVTCPTSKDIGKNSFMVKTTDVAVYTGNYKYSSYGGINGYTLIDVEDLRCIDNVSVCWVPEVKAIKVWVEDGLEVSPIMLKPIPMGLTYCNSCYQMKETYYQDFYYYQPSPGGIVLVSAVCRSNSGSYLACPLEKLYITDIIDADGNSVMKPNKNGYYSNKSANLSFFGYVYGITDDVISASIIIGPNDLLPQTASDPGGLIKVKYTGCFSFESYDTIRLDHLPYPPQGVI